MPVGPFAALYGAIMGLYGHLCVGWPLDRLCAPPHTITGTGGGALEAGELVLSIGRERAPPTHYKHIGGSYTMCTGPRPWIPAEGVAAVRLIYTLFGQRIMNTLYFAKPTAWNAAELQELVTSADAAYNARMRPLMPADLVLDTIEAQDLSVEGGPGVLLDVNRVGGVAQPALPGSVTVAVKLSGGFTGRSRRGRIYWPALGEAAVSGNSIGGTTPADIAAAVLAFAQDVIAGSAADTHVVVSYCGNGAWRTSALVTTVTSYSVDPNIDSQRRRLNTRGD